MAKITIQTTDSVISFDALVDFSLHELPYFASGYRNDGSSVADPNDLSKYWTMIDDFLISVGISNADYVTLLSIEES